MSPTMLAAPAMRPAAIRAVAAARRIDAVFTGSPLYVRPVLGRPLGARAIATVAGGVCVKLLETLNWLVIAAMPERRPITWTGIQHAGRVSATGPGGGAYRRPGCRRRSRAADVRIGVAAGRRWSC